MVERPLVQGCYLACYTTGSGSQRRHYDGTVRVQIKKGQAVISGDLYDRPVSGKKPDPAEGIPIFPLDDYRFYIRTNETPPATIESELKFELFLWEFKRTSPNPSDFKWVKTGPYTARLSLDQPPQGEDFPAAPEAPLYLSGSVTDANKQPTGKLTMGWVEEHLRRARLKIARVILTEGGGTQKSEVPWNNGLNDTLATWQTVFNEVGWNIKLPAPGEITEFRQEGVGEEWDAGELHKKLLDLRSENETKTDWCYHLLCVPKIVGNYGLMFDDVNTDFQFNELPREAAAVSSHIEYPDTPKWGTARGKRCGEALIPYFRTALHEIGHAMGLLHDHQNNARRIMTETTVLDEDSAAEPGKTVPERILFSFTEADAKRLRHMPDIWVRPGGMPFDEASFPYSDAPISAGDGLVEADALRLEVFPLLKEVPFGAPVRINYRLANTSCAKINLPGDLSLKSGCVRGKVTGPDQVERGFRSIFKCMDPLDSHGAPGGCLAPGKSALDSMTLLRGRGGALFPSQGDYVVAIEVSWRDREGKRTGCVGKTSVKITPASRADTARKLCADPRTLIAVAIRGDHFKDSIKPGLDDPELRPHYVLTEAKRLARRFFGRAAELEQACELLLDNPVMSSAEIDWIAKAIEDSHTNARQNPIVLKLCRRLKEKLRSVSDDVDDAVRERVLKLPG